MEKEYKIYTVRGNSPEGEKPYEYASRIYQEAFGLIPDVSKYMTYAEDTSGKIVGTLGSDEALSLEQAYWRNWFHLTSSNFKPSSYLTKYTATSAEIGRDVMKNNAKWALRRKISMVEAIFLPAMKRNLDIHYKIPWALVSDDVDLSRIPEKFHIYFLKKPALYQVEIADFLKPLI